MIGETPVVSVIVPALNEEQDIKECLEHVLNQDYPLDRLEVIVVDGGSQDLTPVIAREVLKTSNVRRWEVLHDSIGATPSNLNTGLAAARGDVVCRVDARSLVPANYVRTCAGILRSRRDVMVVGGRQLARARADAGIVARGIARGLRNPWGTGFARYRRSRIAGPADTVYLGAFRRSDLKELGGWNDRFLTNQDYELNQRMSARGVVWFDPSIEVSYRPRTTMLGLVRQYFRFGRSKAAGWREGSVPIALRQRLLLAVPVGGAFLGLQLLRRRPGAAALLSIAVAYVVESRVREPAPILERIVSVSSIGVAGLSWWLGVVGDSCLPSGRTLVPQEGASATIR